MLPTSAYKTFFETQDQAAGTEASVSLGTGGGTKHMLRSSSLTISCPV